MGLDRPSSAATPRWSMSSGSISTRTTNGISMGRRSRWAIMNTARCARCWSTWPSATASRSSCRKPGAEGSAKPSWLHYVCNEVRDAMDRGADVARHLLVPDHRLPGWDNSRHAETGPAVHRRRRRHAPRRPAPARRVRGAAGAVRPCAGGTEGNRRRTARLDDRRRLRLSDGVPMNGQPSRHWMRSISRIRRLLISSSWRWRGRFTSMA